MFTLSSLHFFAIGINHKKTDTVTRGIYAINNKQYINLLKKYSSYNINSFFVLSTCNRTEIYAIANTSEEIIRFLCSETLGDVDCFLKTCYIKINKDAIKHLFTVSAGIDSQILGDYEIISQIKLAFQLSKINNCINDFMERLFNTALQCAKNIKTNTKLSSGTISASFAAIQYLKVNFKNIEDKKILIIGTGKLGTSICKNLIDYLKIKHISLINRTEATAKNIASCLKVKWKPFNNLIYKVNEYDIIFVTTNAANPLFGKSDIYNKNKKIFFDLSIPNNINPNVTFLKNINLVNIDELSKIKDETLAARKKEIPIAKKIIANHIESFMLQLEDRKLGQTIKAVKKKLQDMRFCKLFLTQYPSNKFKYNDNRINKIISTTAKKMRHKNNTGCNYLEALNEYILEYTK